MRLAHAMTGASTILPSITGAAQTLCFSSGPSGQLAESMRSYAPAQWTAQPLKRRRVTVAWNSAVDFDVICGAETGVQA